MLSHWLEAGLSQLQSLPLQNNPSFPRTKMHTFYGGAHLFQQGTLEKLTHIGQQGVETFFPTPERFSDWYEAVCSYMPKQPALEGQLHLPPNLCEQTSQQFHHCLLNRVQSEFVEDYRIDFEDGYGNHDPLEEYAQARRCAEQLALMLLKKQNLKLPEMGIRLKPLSSASRAHAFRILYEFMLGLAEKLGSHLVEGIQALPHFWVTIPKCCHHQEVSFIVEQLSELERLLGLANNTIGLEIMFETLQAVTELSHPEFINRWLAHCVRQEDKRPTALVLGTYDTCAQWGVIGAAQGHTHPLLDHVRLSAGGWGRQLGVPVIDSITRAIPRLTADIAPLVIHARNVLHSLSFGVMAGWDVHPLQVLSRHATWLAYVGTGLPKILERLIAFEKASTNASRVDAGFDDHATVRALSEQLHKALSFGLITESEVEAQGLSWPPRWGQDQNPAEAWAP